MNTTKLELIPLETITKEQRAEVTRLKQYFPFRICFGCVDKDTGEFTSSAVHTMRIPNKLARQGHSVFILH